jgi:hypothetical protein
MDQRAMYFQILGEIAQLETIAKGSSLRSRHKLAEKYGRGNWRKLKGAALVQLPNGIQRLAEVHWYEAHGIGKKDLKIKKFLD